MLNSKEIEEYFERAGLSDTAINVIQRIRSSGPERRVSSGANNVACHYASKKMGFTIQAESHTNELAALLCWEFDDSTYEIYDQPQKLKVSYVGKNGKRTTHFITPDYFLLQEDFAGWVECKPEQKLQEIYDSGSQQFVKDEEGKWRYPAAENAATELGLKFIVRSSADNNPTFVRNLEFLADYLDERCPPVSENDANEILRAFEQVAWHNLRELIDAGYASDNIYKMIVDEQLYFDLTSDLISNANRAIIYRDSETAQAYKIHINSQKYPVCSHLSIFDITSGQTFSWDGVLWTILNVGDKFLSIENDNKIFLTLEQSRFEQLIKEGIISCVSKSESPDTNSVEDILRHASPQAYQQALHRYQQLFPENPNQVKVPERTKRRWKKMYREAEQIYGNGFVGLLSTANNRGNHSRKIDHRVLGIIEDVIKELYMVTNGKSATLCCGEVALRCSKEGLVAPSEKTILSLIKELSSYEIKKTRDGEKAAYSNSQFIWYLEQSTPRHGERPFEIGHIDHTEVDLQLVDSTWGSNLGKVILTVLLDAYTRMVLAWHISYDPPSYRSCMAVIRDCVKRHARVPKYLVIDQGSDFKSTYFDCLLARIESHKKMRPSSKPRFGSLIERFFGVSNQRFIHNLIGHNKPLQNARALSRDHDPRALAVWTLPTFRDAFESYIENVYSQMLHPAFGISPREVMTKSMQLSGMRTHKYIQYNSEFMILTSPTTQKGTAKVDSSRGVKIGYIYYWNPEFKQRCYANRQMHLRYDPDNIAVAMVWLDDHWVTCESEYKEIFHNHTEKEIKDATNELRSRFKKEFKHRSINAQVLAEFFREVTKTEQGLIEKQRRLESSVQSSASLIKAENPKELPITNTKERPDLWENLKIKAMKEFEA